MNFLVLLLIIIFYILNVLTIKISSTSQLSISSNLDSKVYDLIAYNLHYKGTIPTSFYFNKDMIYARYVNYYNIAKTFLMLLLRNEAPIPNNGDLKIVHFNENQEKEIIEDRRHFIYNFEFLNDVLKDSDSHAYGYGECLDFLDGMFQTLVQLLSKKCPYKKEPTDDCINNSLVDFMKMYQPKVQELLRKLFERLL